MAKRRMLHIGVSYSKQVNSLSEFEQLLFTWIIPHLDDFGRIEGDAAVLRAKVMPMNNRTIEEFETAIQSLVDVGLINRYEIAEGLVIEYPKFETYQTGLNKRTESKFPPNPNSKGTSKKLPEIPGNSQPTEENRSEAKGTQPKLIKPNRTKNLIGDKKIPIKETVNQGSGNNPTSGDTPDSTPEPINSLKIINPDFFEPKSREEVAALEVWQRLEPKNKFAFMSTYLKSVRRGLPADLLYQWASDIEQDPKVINGGQVINKKIKDYFFSKGIEYK